MFRYFTSSGLKMLAITFALATMSCQLRAGDAPHAIDVAVKDDQSLIGDSSLWSHQLTVLKGEADRLVVRSPKVVVPDKSATGCRVHDKMGETLFNPPSLRGVSQRAPYFHDGRAATLTDVLRSSHHDPEHPLTEEQIEWLLLLLETI